MNKFASGMVAGSIVGALGLGYALRDKRMRKKIVRDSKRVADKASHMVNNLSDMF